MNLALEEDHRVAEMLVTLAVKEDGENWRDEFWSLAAAPETWAVPASWCAPSDAEFACFYCVRFRASFLMLARRLGRIEEVPREGMLTLTFESKEWPDGDICIKTRAELSERTFAAEARLLEPRK